MWAVSLSAFDMPFFTLVSLSGFHAFFSLLCFLVAWRASQVAECLLFFFCFGAFIVLSLSHFPLFFLLQLSSFKLFYEAMHLSLFTCVVVSAM